jgi:internalin A
VVLRFDVLDSNVQRMLSKVDGVYAGLLQALTDEAKDGPRLFSLVPVNRRSFNPKQWTSEKFRLTLWCEHSPLPLPVLNQLDSKQAKRGVYEVEFKREGGANG